jgi:tRNA nucleotidyltransferase (CCA-adding enzyme)
MVLPNYVKKIIHTLEQAGYEAYAVGGCVRDSLIGLTPLDYDITTSATPDEARASLAGFSVHDTGIKHGTITVIADETPVEVTTFRIDGEYSDNRRPDSVEFTRSLKDDLSRRDFTINAMTYSDKMGIVDPFGGREDLQNKLIRCVGDPYKRFNEDGLRILRAYRFSAVYGFKIEEETSKSAYELRHLIRNISGERIAQELNKIASAHFCTDKVTGLFLMFVDFGMDEKSTRRLMRRLKYDNDTFYKVTTLVKYRNIPVKACNKAVKRLLNRFGEELFFKLMNINSEAVKIAQDIIKNGDCYSLKHLAVNGGDLVKLGYKGREIGEKLNFLLQSVISEKCDNNKDELLDFLKGK